MRNLTSSVEGIPLEHSFFRNKVLVVCGLWRTRHSVYRNFMPYVRSLQTHFQVRHCCPSFRACALCPRVPAVSATIRSADATCECNVSIARCRCHSSYQTHRMGKPPSTRQALWMSRS
jgi:hypothetical protein